MTWRRADARSAPTRSGVRELSRRGVYSTQPNEHMGRHVQQYGQSPAAKSFGLAIIPWGPLCGGLLTGKYDREQGDAGGRWQQGKHNFGREATPRACDLIDLLRGMAAEKGCSVSQLALAWCASQPGVTAPIIGPRTFAQAADNLGAVKVRLDAADFERIDALVPPKSVAVRYYDAAAGLDFRPHRHRSVV